MWKLALNHADIFSNYKQWAKCLTMNYFHRTILGLVGTISLLAQNINKRGVSIRMSWYEFFEKINSRGGGDVYSGLESISLASWKKFILFAV